MAQEGKIPQNPLNRPDVFVFICTPRTLAVGWKTGTRGLLEALVDKNCLRQDWRQGITPKVVLWLLHACVSTYTSTFIQEHTRVHISRRKENHLRVLSTPNRHLPEPQWGSPRRAVKNLASFACGHRKIMYRDCVESISLAWLLDSVLILNLAEGSWESQSTTRP